MAMANRRVFMFRTVHHGDKWVLVQCFIAGGYTGVNLCNGDIQFDTRSVFLEIAMDEDGCIVL